jgi:hypothetical protein
MKHSIALGILGSASLIASADAGISGFVAYSRNVGANTVIDVFAVTTNASDKFLNVYNTVSNGTFVQKAGLAVKTWKPDVAGFTSTRATSDDSFMTAGTFSGAAYGGEYFASSNTNGDPNFTGTSWNATPASAAATTIPYAPPENLGAGWYTGDPTSVDNRTEVLAAAVSGGVRYDSVLVTSASGYQAPPSSIAAVNGIWVSHLVLAGNNKKIGIDFTWTASISIKDGVTGTTTQATYRFAAPDGDGDGVPDSLDQCPAEVGTVSCNGCPTNACGGCGTDPDADQDGILDCNDNCPGVANQNQADCNQNGIGDACESFPDCNQNGQPDACDIAGGASDCNGNAVPDSCELTTSTDCDQNGVLDTCEIADRDCNANGIIDACDIATGAADCNANGVIDTCDLASGTSADLNGNGVPDECKPDCDGNGVPDEFELADGLVPDCNADAIPDNCQGARMVRLQSSNLGAPSGTAARAWNVVGLVPAESSVKITIDLRGDLDGQTEWVDVLVGNAAPRRFFDVTGNDCPAEPDRAEIVLSRSEFNAMLGGNNRLTIRVEAPITVDPSECKGNGLTVISIAYVGIDPSADCNANQRLDICETNDGTTPDCNSNDRPDSCDIASGTSADCDGSGVPDSCEVIATPAIDCNGNGVPDSCDLLAGGAAVDCDASGRLDSCELAEIAGIDCNGNGRIDSCDIASGFSEDVDADGRPDDCQVIDVPAQFPSIQAAIDSIPVDEMRIVRVAPGDYAGPVNFRGKAARLVASGGAASTFITGSGGQYSSVILAVSNESALALLRGFTIRGGRTGTQLPLLTSAWCGGGMLAIGTSMSIRDCVFEDNDSTFGGGMYMLSCGGRVESTTFRQCRASAYGGGVQLFECTTVISGCTVTQCSAVAAGGGVHVAQGGAVIELSNITNNTAYERGGGLSYDPFDSAPSRSLRVSTTSIQFNVANADGGGIYVYPWAANGALLLEDSTVCNNQSQYGARNITGRYTTAGSTQVCDCTGDCTFDSSINGSDLARVLSQWGFSFDNEPADVTLDGVIDGRDLAAVLANWGECGQ